MRNPKIVALVPMRHHSQRVPGKNYRALGDKPLFHHIISTLLNVPEISEIVVNTDSPEVIAVRLKNAVEEMAQKDLYRHIITNDRLADAVAELIAIFEKYRS